MKAITRILGLGLLVLTVTTGKASADVLRVAPSEAVVLQSDEAGLTCIALRFDVSGMREGSGRVIFSGNLEWTIQGVASDEGSEFFVHEITEDWQEAQVQETETVEYSATPLHQWEIWPLDYERVGGFVRLNLLSLVESWCDHDNYGVVVTTPDVAAEVLGRQLANARLVVGYSFYGGSAY